MRAPEFSRCYVAVRFLDNAGESRGRPYTYHWDGPPPQPGDVAIVDGFEGWSRVAVVDVTDDAPPFATKPLLEICDPNLTDSGRSTETEALQNWEEATGLKSGY